jgi:hypothetical protein
MTAIRQLKQRECKVCLSLFSPRNTLQKVCSTYCALHSVLTRKEKLLAREKAAARRAAVRELREAKVKLKTRRQWMAEAQAAFNAYIRYRDTDLPCISCGDFTPMTRGGDYDCGHYRSVGANPELRFHEQNSNRQCKRCNGHLSGNIANYRIGLLLKYGPEVVAEIEGPHEVKKYTTDELIAIKKEYQAKLKQLKRSPLCPD